jgi:hypothetical protein
MALVRNRRNRHASLRSVATACGASYRDRSADGSLPDSWQRDGTHWTSPRTNGSKGQMPGPRARHQSAPPSSRSIGSILGSAVWSGSGSDSPNWCLATTSGDVLLTERVFGDDLVFALAQKQPDGPAIRLGVAALPVDGGEVEAELAPPRPGSYVSLDGRSPLHKTVGDRACDGGGSLRGCRPRVCLVNAVRPPAQRPGIGTFYRTAVVLAPPSLGLGPKPTAVAPDCSSACSIESRTLVLLGPAR